MKNKVPTNKNIFKKIDINSKNYISKTGNASKNNFIFISDLRKIKPNNITNIINDHSYIPKTNILKLLVKHQQKNITDDIDKNVIPLRNRIYDYQSKNDEINKEIKELRNETKAFLNRYKMSGLLTPKNNSHFLKLGISQETINNINSEGYKMNDILNKTNIFDKSLLLNKHYANFARNIVEEKNPELINDSKYIKKMKESLNDKKGSDLFVHSNNLSSKKKIRRRTSIYNIDLNKLNIEEETKVSIVQLINEFKIINNDLKMISNQKILKERNKRRLKQKELINKSLNKSRKILFNLEKNKTEKKRFPSINEKEKNLAKIRNRSVSMKIIKKETFTSQRNKNNDFELNNIGISLPNLRLSKKKSVFNNILRFSSNNDSSNNSLVKSFNLSPDLKKINNNDEIYKNKRKNFNPINKIKRQINSSRNSSQINNFKSIISFSKDDTYSNYINKTEESKICKFTSNPEKRKAQIEEYKRRKNYFLQNLYNNLKIKRFKENRNDISEYLKIYKGASIKEPNYEIGSQIYNIINEFIKKNKEYNLPNEINKIRNKTNMFSYQRNRIFEEIKKQNNKVQNLIYDYAEDILDLNSDIKK